MIMYFVLPALAMYFLADGFGYHTTFGFCHDSLNSLNSEKFFRMSLDVLPDFSAVLYNCSCPHFRWASPLSGERSCYT